MALWSLFIIIIVIIRLKIHTINKIYTYISQWTALLSLFLSKHKNEHHTWAAVPPLSLCYNVHKTLQQKSRTFSPISIHCNTNTNVTKLLKLYCFEKIWWDNFNTVHAIPPFAHSSGEKFRLYLLTGISTINTTGPWDSTAPAFMRQKSNSKSIVITVFTRWQHNVILWQITEHQLPLKYFLSHTIKEQ